MFTLMLMLVERPHCEQFLLLQRYPRSNWALMNEAQLVDQLTPFGEVMSPLIS